MKIRVAGYEVTLKEDSIEIGMNEKIGFWGYVKFPTDDKPGIEVRIKTPHFEWSVKANGN